MYSRFTGVLALILALVLPALTLSAQFRGDAYGNLYDSETVSLLKEHVSFLASAQMEGRKAGSEGEKMAATYLYDALESCGVDMVSPKEGDPFGIVTDSDTLISRNVYGYVPGYDKSLSGEFIVVGARLDNLGTLVMTVDGETVTGTYSGANGNASGLAMLIELARKVSTNSLLFRRPVVFAAFGASCSGYMGSWYFTENSFKEKVNAFVNLDMLGGGEGFTAYTSSNSDLNALLGSMKGSLQPAIPVLTAAEPYPSDHRIFYAREIPSVTFTTGRYPEHNTVKDTPSILDYELMERELEYIYNFIQLLSCTGEEILFNPALKEEVKKISAAASPGVVSYFDCDQKPMFSNSPDISKFMKDWVYRLLKYPKAAVEQGIQGTVQVSFVIDRNGAVRDVQVVRSVHPLLDDEAVKVISASPKWRPARVRGEKVSSSMTIGVEFRLRHKGERGRFGINGY